MLENRPPIKSSVSNEKMRRCLVHFFFGVLDSRTGLADDLPRLLRRTKNKISPRIASVPTTTGTATAAFRPGEHDTLLHSVSEVTLPVSEPELPAAVADELVTTPVL